MTILTTRRGVPAAAWVRGVRGVVSSLEDFRHPTDYLVGVYFVGLSYIPGKAFKPSSMATVAPLLLFDLGAIGIED